MDPYRVGPEALDDDIVSAVDPRWRQTPAPYGPGFLVLAEGSVAITRASDVGAIYVLRLLALLGLALVALVLPALARAHGGDPAGALVLVVANPITLVHLVSGAHNEALMIGLLATGLLLGRRHALLGMAACGLAAAIKAPALLGCAYLGWQWASSAPKSRVRLGRLALAGAVPVGVLAALGNVTGWGWAWLTAAVQNRAIDTSMSISTWAGKLLARVLSTVELEQVQAGVVDGTRFAFVLAAVVLVAYLLTQHRRLQLRALAGSLLVVALLGPSLQPWYLLWGFVALAAVSACVAHRVIVGLSVLLLFAALPVGPRFDLELFAIHPALVLASAAALLVPLTLGPVTRDLRAGAALRER